MGSAFYKSGNPAWDPTLGGAVNALKTLGPSISARGVPVGRVRRGGSLAYLQVAARFGQPLSLPPNIL